MNQPRPNALQAHEARRALPPVIVVFVLAILAVIAVVATEGPVAPMSVPLALVLLALGVAAEFIAYDLSRDSSGSVALIPFSAALLVSPHLWTIGAIIVGEIGVQAVRRRSKLKAAFNTAHYCLGLCMGLLALRATGGVELSHLASSNFVDSARAALLPVASVVAAMLATTTVTLSAVLSATQQRKFFEVLGQVASASARYSPILVILAFYLAWLSINLGFVGALGMVIPILAVRQLYQTAAELSNVTEELLDLMVAAIEARDPYTSGHSQRVAKASGIIARALGLSDAQVERVTVAALLHDVGKIDEAFAKILAKEGRLTPEEWEIMKRHPVRSAELVGMLSSLKDVVAPVRHHHENWDGTGYPDGLKGEHIPLGSRIIMFADTLDAITTDRPYRKALGMSEAKSEFIKFRGKQFDPVICDRILAPDVWAQLYSSFSIVRAVEDARGRAAS